MNPPCASPCKIPLSHLERFLFRAGEDTARQVRGVRTTQNGEMRMSAEARWIPFTADEFIDATRSGFRWQARLDPHKIGSATVTDAYEGGHGYLAVKLAGILPVRRITGSAADKGELQRYFASVLLCPTMLLNHPSLEVTATGLLSLRFLDRLDPTGAEVELGLSEEGQPLAVHAIRPRMVGKNAVDTPWLGRVTEFRDYDGLRVATCFEASWHLPEGEFTYYREKISSFQVVT